jgi:hypothetical protein
MKPTQTGYYWLQTSYTIRSTGIKVLNTPRIVRVAMEYKFRNKTVPYVLAATWNQPLHTVEADAKWSEMIICPFKD